MDSKKILFIILPLVAMLFSGCIFDEEVSGSDSGPNINDDDVIILETSEMDRETIEDLQAQIEELREANMDPDGDVALVRFYGTIGEEDLGTFRDVLVSIGDNDLYSAVVLWIDTPGGGVGSTAAMYNEIVDLRSKKPVVLYTSEMLASGGYYIGCGADLIIADPDALVGNISTIYVHTDASQYYSDFGLKITVIKTGEYKDIGADWRGLTDEEYLWMKNMTYDAYNRFVHVVALGRNMTNEEALEVSDGRIWSGSDALAAGLVDQIGDLDTAIAAAEELAGLTNARVVQFETWDEGSVKMSGYSVALRYQWEYTIEEYIS
ncbi:MAG TPA: signal peptide peptidase SppA [Candidatus Methanofastidiosa archaeon]|nr:signal peptide peptidase SppA [Candidatus Methanofastidiosa archaeon]